MTGLPLSANLHKPIDGPQTAAFSARRIRGDFPLPHGPLAPSLGQRQRIVWMVVTRRRPLAREVGGAAGDRPGATGVDGGVTRDNESPHHVGRKRTRKDALLLGLRFQS